MSISLTNGGGSGEYDRFAAADHANATAILFEPKSLRKDVKTKFGNVDFTDADITVFLSEEEIAKGSPSITLKNAGVGGALGRSIAGSIGGAAVGKLGQVDTGKGNPAWVLDAISADQVAGIAAYLDAREAARSASLPSFLQGN